MTFRILHEEALFLQGECLGYILLRSQGSYESV